MSGSDLTGLTLDDLRQYAESHHAAFENGPAVIVDSGGRDGGIDLVYNCAASVPSEALSAFAVAEAYLEGLFSDDITVAVSCSFDNLGGSVLGVCSSSYVTNATYFNSRNGLQAGMDSDDVLQSWLPSGNTCPVRYNGSSSTITDENRVDWTTANYRCTVGSVSGTAAAMIYNSSVSWDYDPSNGVSYFATSFVDVVCHETGHALGFVSAVDDQDNHMEAMDLYRFSRIDGDYDYNPDTYVEFQTTPRLVDYNNPNDEHISDLINYTYRMEDGYPYQASHFREANNYGCMGPTVATGFTRYPEYYTAADKNMFDVLGYDYPPCDTPEFLTQPEPSQTLCAGEDVVLSVEVDIPSALYQWRVNTTELIDDGVHIFGATTDTLTIVGLTEDDAADKYNCLVINNADGCPGFSDNAEIVVDTDVPVITQQPQDQTVTAGDPAWFFIVLESTFAMEYQWRKDGLPLSDDDRITGATTSFLMIGPTELGDAGEYDCVVTYELGMQCSVTSDAATLTVDPSGQDCPNPGASGNYCTADIDGSGDCVVDLADLALLLSNYGITSGATPDQGDIDPPGGDGNVDLGDLAALLSQYGEDCN
ncbi:MAG: NF038122 family metalloprotease [Planctomycetes bacterium]|nr:NF038122 family metalloprotease [Planctomycetota bacterium]